MNVICAEIKEIQSQESLALVHCSAQGEDFYALILDHENMRNMTVGASVELIFKEAEVMVATEDSRVSARNSFVSKIKNIKSGVLLAQIEFDFHGIPVFALITRQSSEELGLKIGESMRWCVKVNEIFLRMV
ncbi:MAG: TOBE domain-containing protein [Wolinella sp.]